MVDADSERAEDILICGLGALGQHCAATVREFGVEVAAIALEAPQAWELADLDKELATLVIGDCRQNAVLERAGITRCRAVLIVTGDDRVNAETALAVRALNPRARLVMRSARSNLDRLLEEHLGNFIAFDPSQLSANAFALTALGNDTVGFFYLDTHLLQVKDRPYPADGQSRSLLEFNKSTRRLLAYTPQDRIGGQLNSFYQWEPQQQPREGDRIAYIKLEERHSWTSTQGFWPLSWREGLKKHLQWENLRPSLVRLWRSVQQVPSRRVAFACGAIVGILLGLGTALFSLAPGKGILEAFGDVVTLLLGGYGDVDFQNPWLQLLGLLLTLTGIALVGVLYALVTEALLSAKFQLTQRRPPVPKENHVLLVGLGRVGQRVARLLLDFQQPIVGLPLDSEFDRTLLQEMPLVCEGMEEAIERANVANARSAILVTGDEMLNLEMALMIRGLNPQCQLTIRTFGQRLSDNLSQLLPEATAISAYAVVAEAFAGAAFGENILSLFRLRGVTILVTEYCIETGDTLEQKILAEVACGYDVVPLSHQKPGETAKLFPDDYVRLSHGDRLVVLATIEGLRRIEDGQLNLEPRRWQVRLERALTKEAVFDGGNIIAQFTGCDLSMARQAMDNIPWLLPTRLYRLQAYRLVRELSRNGVKASVLCLPSPRGV